MKKNNFFHLLMMLGIFGLFADDGSGAGGGVDEHDFNIDDEDIEPTPPKKEEVTTPIQNDEPTDEQKRIKALEDQLEEQDAQKAFNDSINELKSKHDGFDENKVEEYLKKLHETNPNKANELNNKVGWELIWATELKPKDVENDNPNLGRNIDPVERASEVLDAVASGGVTLADEQEVMSKFL